MMAFAIEKLGIKTFQVKIGESNVESINLFKKLVCPLLLYPFFSHIKGMRCLTTVTFQIDNLEHHLEYHF